MRHCVTIVLLALVLLPTARPRPSRPLPGPGRCSPGRRRWLRNRPTCRPTPFRSACCWPTCKGPPVSKDSRRTPRKLSKT